MYLRVLQHGSKNLPTNSSATSNYPTTLSHRPSNRSYTRPQCLCGYCLPIDANKQVSGPSNPHIVPYHMHDLLDARQRRSHHHQHTLTSPSTHPFITINTPFHHHQHTLSSPPTHPYITISTPFHHHQHTLSSPSAHPYITINTPLHHHQHTLTSPSTHPLNPQVGA